MRGENDGGSDEALTCPSCLNDAAVPGIEFGADGVCSYCREYEEWKDRLTDWARLDELWLQRVEYHRGRGEQYDALVGLSGGKDSTYVLYQLAKVHGLRVLAFTIDNGFLNEWARGRVAEIIKTLDVDHLFVDFPKEVLAPLYKMSIMATGAPCSGCSYAVYSATIKLAEERKIPMAVHGRSRPQMFKHLSFEGNDPFTPFIRSALEPIASRDLKATYAESVNRIRASLPSQLVGGLMERFFPSFTKMEKGQSGEAGQTDKDGSLRLTEFVPYFIYHPYEERKMVKLLEEKIGWKPPDDYDILKHFDCDAHDAAGYLYHIVEGRPHVLPELSVMIREGQLTREEAKKRLELERSDVFPGKSMKALANILDTSPSDLEADVRRLSGS